MDGTVELSQILEVSDLGAVIREYRKSQGVTQVDAAREAMVGPRFLGELENGKATVRLGTVLQVLERLGLGLYVEVPVNEVGYDPLDDVPNMTIEGWSGFKYAIGSAMLLRNSGGDAITAYCILDRDYYSDAEIRKRYGEAGERNVTLHIWQRKEIENYLLVPEAIHRVLVARAKDIELVPDLERIRSKLDEIALELRDQTVDAIATEIISERRCKLTEANRDARANLDRDWSTPEGRLARVSGKHVFTRISKWATDECGGPVGKMAVLAEMRSQEVPGELRDVLEKIENVEVFDPCWVS